MDGPRFDALTQRLASIRLTRSRALRGITVGALTLAGMATVADEASAGKKKKLCKCPDANATCTTDKKSKQGRKRYLKSHPCSYKGKCRGTGTKNPCEGAGAPVTVNTTLLGAACTVGGTDCGTGTGLECVADVCVPIDLGDICAEDADCSTGRCAGLVCAECPETDICESGDDAQCCVADATCVGGLCVLPLSSLE